MVQSEDRDSNAAVCRDSGEFGADYLAELTEGAAESAESSQGSSRAAPVCLASLTQCNQSVRWTTTPFSVDSSL